MGHLGSFAAAKRELTRKPDDVDTFEFGGEKFEVTGEIPTMLMLQLAASTTGKIGEAEGLAAMWEVLRVGVGDEQFNRLFRLAVDNNADLEDVMRLVFALFEAQGGRPTQAASDSPPGPLSTSPSASISSITPGHPPLRPVSELIAG